MAKICFFFPLYFLPELFSGGWSGFLANFANFVFAAETSPNFTLKLLFLLMNDTLFWSVALILGTYLVSVLSTVVACVKVKLLSWANFLFWHSRPWTHQKHGGQMWYEESADTKKICYAMNNLESFSSAFRILFWTWTMSNEIWSFFTLSNNVHAYHIWWWAGWQRNWL